MLDMRKPTRKPKRPFFSSGPCAKRPGWSLGILEGALLGRSHRCVLGKERINKAIQLTRKVLEVPENYRIAIVPASDTGAVEMALWSLLGYRGVDVLAWESFGLGWMSDIRQLSLQDVREFTAPYGSLPDFSKVDFDRDVVFVWNGTTSGVCVPDVGFIPESREGLVICDATSAVFARHIDFNKLDVVTFSAQKVLGGEAGFGIIILSPASVERLEKYVPSWPLPKIFRMVKGGRVMEGLFCGETINTPSLLCIEDYIDALLWLKKMGGLSACVERCNANAAVLFQFIQENDWIENLAVDETTRSNTSICMKIVDSDIASLDINSQKSFCKSMLSFLEKEEIAYDIGSYRDAPLGLRVWVGVTVEKEDLLLLCDWLRWVFYFQKISFLRAIS
ncbi:phosphoserine transaminase [Candidatus Liberibacter asiaticus]|uniref:phosphoserine transaminase n=3 Tax=Liberibacter asiaticus TaxID=34021 RepID=C6XH81_LIBAP|nr:phosphoserine transaminase [Candidatus Liberibacter asiaticus]ACT56626.1 phosphoserine aminotransferase [Candidatus Liberibacter asiaticus str. psy62]AGH16394.1 phosphoserine aminotransferase [Candidatus Liberibacter asiaticus str. gxpsy]ALK06814.1 phosphoserine transaminase [Candidatus Liberibacter asiaticus]ASK52279.1 phosphoserine aminotransferase [Candidatus Liberibacter asiaticus]AWL13601.1 phosphoserine transaminase [Candidatus Liberibacter asiaticus]